MFKDETVQKRQERVPEEWSNIQMFCSNGILPPVSKLCELEDLFPKCRYWRDEIAEVMGQCTTAVKQIHSSGEADVDIARAASGHSTSYVLGQDSDFCFFPRVKYIPLDTLDASNSSLVATGIVLERHELARAIGMVSEKLMVETAILLGNDYNSAMTNETFANVVEFVKGRSADYQVTNRSENELEKLRFIRALYELEETGANVIDDDDELSTGDEILDSENRRGDQNGSDPTARPQIPLSIDLDLLLIDFRSDKGVKDSVVRCLRAYYQLVVEGGEEEPMITEDQLVVFETLDCSHRTMENEWRPSWRNIRAAYIIEKLISLALKQKSPIAHMSLPSKIFDQQLFLYLMCSDSSGDSSFHLGHEETGLFDGVADQPRAFEAGEKQPLPVVSIHWGHCPMPLHWFHQFCPGTCSLPLLTGVIHFLHHRMSTKQKYSTRFRKTESQ